MSRIQRWILAFGILISLISAALLWAALRHDNDVKARTLSAEAEEEAAYIPPAATSAQREARRMARYDRNRDDFVSYEEYMVSRRKAFAKLDRDQDGRLSFEEYAVKTAEKFRKADQDGNRRLDAVEFATTAVRKTGGD